MLVGTDERRRRSVPGARTAGFVAHDGLAAQDLADLVVAQGLVFEQRLGDLVQFVDALGEDFCVRSCSPSSIRRLNLLVDDICAVASETFCVCVTA